MPVGQHVEKHLWRDIILRIIGQHRIHDAAGKGGALRAVEIAAGGELRCREQRHVGDGGTENMPARDPQRGQEVLIREKFRILHASAGLDVGIECDLRYIGSIFLCVFNQLLV